MIRLCCQFRAHCIISNLGEAKIKAFLVEEPQATHRSGSNFLLFRQKEMVCSGERFIQCESCPLIHAPYYG